MFSSVRSSSPYVIGALLFTLPGLVGCNAGVSSSGDDDDGSNTKDPPTVEPPDEEAFEKACDSDVTLGASALKRLSRIEYFHTLRDLFPGVDVGRPEFIADQSTLGFENRARDLFATEQNVGSFNNASIEIAGKAVDGDHLKAIMPCAGEDEACYTQFVEKFGLRAYRRPLEDGERQRYVDFFNKQKSLISFKDTVRLTIEAMLQSPNFLYRPEFGGNELDGGKLQVVGYDMANRLSYFIWGSMPDADLFEAAAAGLDKREDVMDQAWRMLGEEKARAQIVDFYRQWLDYDHIDLVFGAEGKKDPDLYPQYDQELAAAMREEAQRFSGAALFDRGRTLGDLLNGRETFVNGKLADLYGVDRPDGDNWGSVTLDEGERAGILTQGAFLASHAHKLSGSPPLRGNFIRTRFLCGEPLSPDPDANTSEPVPSGDEPRTNRELFAMRLKDGGTSCVGCHTQFDPMGNTFENYDAVGGYRSQDNGIDVDASGALVLEDGNKDVKNAIELSATLAEADQTLGCMTGYWFEFALGRNKEDFDGCKIAALTKALKEADGDIRHLQLSLVGLPDFQQRLTQ